MLKQKNSTGKAHAETRKRREATTDSIDFGF